MGYYYTATDEYDIKWTMPHCVLTLKLIGMMPAFNYHLFLTYYFPDFIYIQLNSVKLFITR